MIRKEHLVHPPGILTIEEKTILFFQEPFFNASWTISYGPGWLNWFLRSATRAIDFEPFTSDGVEFAEKIRRNLERK